MKKIFSILISLLFIGSTFWIASVLAESNGIDCCAPENFHISRTSVKPGETFTVSFNSFCIPQITDEDQEEFVEKINFKIYDGNGNILANFDPRDPDEPSLPSGSDIWWEWTYKAVKPGAVVFGMNCGTDCYTIPNCSGDNCEVCNQICNCYKTVTISSRALPMNWIMNKFGLGNKDKE